MSFPLNAPQQAAVDHHEGALLVFAGAGSGKTRVITQRIAALIQRGAAPSRILAVTFTNKAAGEMRDRLEGTVGQEAARAVTISTFHALCVRLLRSKEALSWTGRTERFVIYDERDAESLLTAICEEELFDDEGSEKIAKAEKKTAIKSFVEDCAAFIEQRKQSLTSPEEFSADPSEAAKARVWARYEAAKFTANAFDFADLIFFGTKLAEMPGSLGDAPRAMYDFLLIDEFQDTDRLQLRLVKALAAKGNLCVVGDDDQCIYAWRGADIDNIRGFRKHFPQAAVVKLEQNYRSSKNVVDAAVSVIERAVTREPKRMHTSAAAGDLIKVVSCRDEWQEAQVISAQVQALVAQGVAPSSIAVLYRNHATARIIEQELRSVPMRYTTHGGFRWFDRAEIRDALSLFKLAVNTASNVDCLRGLKAVVRGIGKNTAGKFVELSSKLRIPLLHAMRRTELVKLRNDQKESIRRFTSLVIEAGMESRSAGASTVARRILDESGIIAGYLEEAQAVLASEAKSRGVSVEAVSVGLLPRTARETYEAAKQKADRLEELFVDAQRFEERAKRRGDPATFQEYVEAVCLRADDREEDALGVQLMTVHASKGLEFDTVFIPACEGEVFAKSLCGVPRPPPKPGEVGANDSDLEEEDEELADEDDERRLFYVAVTRAKRRLVLLSARQRTAHGRTQARRACPFIREMPTEVIDEVEPEYLIRRAQAVVAEAEREAKEKWR